MSAETVETERVTSVINSPAGSGVRRRGYGALWRAVPRELGFLILTMPVAVIGLSVVASVFFTGVGLAILVVGPFVMVAGLYIARGFGTFELLRLRWADVGPIQPPTWHKATGGFWRVLLAPFANGHYWLYLLHTLVISPIISIVSWTITVVWLSVSLGGLTAWLWTRYIPDNGRHVWLHQVVLDFLFPGNTFSIDPRFGEIVLQFILGALFLVVLPFVFRGTTLMHEGVARGLLGRFQWEEFRGQAVAMDASRGAAVHAEDVALRRLERDIHDGPQQRLVRLQMDLASAERKLESDPESARALLAEARDHAQEGLEELRALSRGVAPAILQDRGLAVALESLAERAPIPVRFEVAPDVATGLPAPIERNAYFIAAELLTNAAKHSGASEARLTVSIRAVAGEHWLDLWLTDNGHGGAAPLPGHGLEGLQERLHGLRGTLVISSPSGGPTTIGAHIPYVPEP